MNIYLASRYSRRAEMLAHAAELRKHGHEITARWISGQHEASDGDKSRWPDFAADDLEDIQRADAVISFTESELWARGGRHVEFGYGLAFNKKMIVIGPVENIFNALPHVLVYPTWQAFVAAFVPASTMGVANG